MRRLRDTLTPEEIDEWIAYTTIEPLWYDRLYSVLVWIAVVVGRSAGVKVSPEEFYNFGTDTKDKALSPQQAADIFRGYFGGHSNR